MPHQRESATRRGPHATVGGQSYLLYMPQIILAPRIVIFDVDGTLVDSVDQHAKAWVDALSDYGHRVPYQTMRRRIGKGGDQLMPVFLSASEIARYGADLESHRAKPIGPLQRPHLLPRPGGCSVGSVRCLLLDRNRGSRAELVSASAIAVASLWLTLRITETSFRQSGQSHGLSHRDTPLLRRPMRGRKGNHLTVCDFLDLD